MEQEINKLKNIYEGVRPPMSASVGFSDVLTRIEAEKRPVVPNRFILALVIIVLAALGGVGIFALSSPANTLNAIKAVTEKVAHETFKLPTPTITSVNFLKKAPSPTPTTTPTPTTSVKKSPKPLDVKTNIPVEKESFEKKTDNEETTNDSNVKGISDQKSNNGNSEEHRNENSNNNPSESHGNSENKKSDN